MLNFWPPLVALFLTSACVHRPLRARDPSSDRVQDGAVAPNCSYLNLNLIPRLKRPIDGSDVVVSRVGWTDGNQSLSFLSSEGEGCRNAGFNFLPGDLPEGALNGVISLAEATSCRIWASPDLVPRPRTGIDRILYHVIEPRSGFEAFTFDREACAAQGLYADQAPGRRGPASVSADRAWSENGPCQVWPYHEAAPHSSSSGQPLYWGQTSKQKRKFLTTTPEGCAAHREPTGARRYQMASSAPFDYLTTEESLRACEIYGGPIISSEEPRGPSEMRKVARYSDPATHFWFYAYPTSKNDACVANGFQKDPDFVGFVNP